MHDELGRLSEERYNSYDNNLDSITRYAFDLASNRRTMVKDNGNTNPGTFTAEVAQRNLRTAVGGWT